MSKRFARQETHRHLRLGKRKKVASWRRPKGRDSKMRLSRKSYPGSPTVGHKTPRKQSGKINQLTPILVYNIKDLGKITKENIAIIAKVGTKKRLEIIKEANSKKIKMFNIKETR